MFTRLFYTVAGTYLSLTWIPAYAVRTMRLRKALARERAPLRGGEVIPRQGTPRSMHPYAAL